MCVIFCYVDSSPLPGGYKLILASNRDEFFARETRPAAKWNLQNDEKVYGGIDLESGREGGTWLAIGGHENGIIKVGALLNLTGEPKPRNAMAQNHSNNCCQNNNINNNNKHNINSISNNTTIASISSNAAAPTATTTTTTINVHSIINVPIHDNHSLLGRGMIVSDFVKSTDNEHTIGEYNRTLLADCTKYSAFNFISIEIGTHMKPSSILHLSNVPPTLEHYEERKCYGFGNSLPAVPFEKVRYGQQRFEETINKFFCADSEMTQNDLIAELQNMLKCKTKFWPDAELKRRAPNWGQHLSSLNVCMQHENYGSRTHTVILVDSNDKMHFIEETMATTDAAGEWLLTKIEKDFS